MAVITYTAKRSLISGHSAGTIYDLEIPANVWTPTDERRTEEVVSLSGKTQTRLHRVDEIYQFGSVPVDSASLQAQMTEFLRSVAGGELFIIDVYGTIASPVNPLTVRLSGNYDITRLGTMAYLSYSFKVRVNA